MRILNNHKKKKGFTLIELVIVLAVLAIIALIAIPNFTKVRNSSLVKADYRAAEQIEKITLMALANKDIVTKDETYIIKNGTSGTEVKLEKPDPKVDLSNYATLLRDVKNPQVPGAKDGGYKVEVSTTGIVRVYYEVGDVTFDGESINRLAGPEEETETTT